MTRPRIGISSCLLGERVRYNGAHKKHDWLVDRLGKYVDWVPLCPEMSMGLGAPRESMNLVLDPQAPKPRKPRLMTTRTKIDLTDRANTASKRLLKQVEFVDGYIFKKNSPSCGLEKVKVYGRNFSPSASGTGFFASAFVEKHPLLPVIEEGRLENKEQRENFVMRVFAYSSLNQLPRRPAELQKFHQSYKLILMAHSPAQYQALGRIAANSRKLTGPQAFEAYLPLFMETLRVHSSIGKRINVLQHILGYLKDKLTAKEKEQLLKTFTEYRNGEVPFLVPLKLLQYAVEKHSIEYLEGQRLFAPYPKELALQRDI